MDGSLVSPPGPHCPECGGPLRALRPAGPIECAGCWFALGVEGQRVGGYELGVTLGAGGAGVVYLARELASDRSVALKLARPNLPYAELVFRQEIENASKLAHPHIVRALACDKTASGQSFLVMELMEQGTLAELVARGAFSQPREILSLVAKLARALEHAHRRAVLHCDLKPENVLFDAEGEPHIADFGLAQPIRTSGTADGTTLGGTRGWMSPEQARRGASAATGEPEALTVASDVFSLGVLLYWLLARRLPFGDGADFEERVCREEPEPPLESRLWLRDLESEATGSCQRALAKDPAARYRTAGEFADDVERALSGQATSFEQRLPLRRAAKWVRRRALLALALVELALLLVYLPLVPFLVVGESRSVIVEQNSNAALHQAGAVMNELRAFGDRLRAMADDPELVAIVEHSDLLATPAALSRYGAGDIDNLIVLSVDGDLRARWPTPKRMPKNRNFAFRDYFQGALRLGQERLRQVYVARTIRSQIGEQFELEMSTALFDRQGALVGVIAGARRAQSTFGAVQMNCMGAGTCMTGLLAPRDADDPGVGLPSAIRVVAAPGIVPGSEVLVEGALSRRICRTVGCSPAARDQFDARPRVRPLIADYFDPVSQSELFGAFAPVGATGFVVVVATPHGAARELSDRMLSKARAYLGVPLLVGLGLVAALLLSSKLGVGGRAMRAKPRSTPTKRGDQAPS